MDNGIVVWFLRPSQYIQKAMKITERCVKDNLWGRWKILKMAVNPFPCGYETMLDASPELDTLRLLRRKRVIRLATMQ